MAKVKVSFLHHQNLQHLGDLFQTRIPRPFLSLDHSNLLVDLEELWLEANRMFKRCGVKMAQILHGHFRWQQLIPQLGQLNLLDCKMRLLQIQLLKVKIPSVEPEALPKAASAAIQLCMVAPLFPTVRNWFLPMSTLETTWDIWGVTIWDTWATFKSCPWTAATEELNMAAEWMLHEWM